MTTRPPGALLVLGGAVCVLVGASVPFLASMSAEDSLRIALLPVAAVDVALVWIAVRNRPPAARTGASLVSPVIVMAVGLGGYWWYRSGEADRFLVDHPGGVVGTAWLDPSQYAPTLTIFLVVAALLLLGSRCWRPVLVSEDARPRGRSESLASLRQRAVRHSGAALLIATVPAVLLIVGYTPMKMLSRDVYRDPSGIAMFFRAGSALSLAGAIIAACIHALPVPRWQQRVAALVFAGYVVMNFSFASRELALMPGAWLLGRILADGQTPRLRRVLGVVLATVLLYSVPLTLRSLDAHHGFVPYAKYVLAHPTMLFDVDADGAVKNVFQTFGVTGWVAFNVDHLPVRYFTVSINPLPAGMTGWDAIAKSEALKVTSYAPYGGIGQLANHGPLFLLGYTLALGAILGAVDRSARRARFSAALLIRVLSAGAGVLLTFQFIQYHLRSASRLAGLVLVAAWAIAAIDRAQARRERSRRLPPPQSWGASPSASTGQPSTRAPVSAASRSASGR